MVVTFPMVLTCGDSPGQVVVISRGVGQLREGLKKKLKMRGIFHYDRSAYLHVSDHLDVNFSSTKLYYGGWGVNPGVENSTLKTFFF